MAQTSCTLYFRSYKKQTTDPCGWYWSSGQLCHNFLEDRKKQRKLGKGLVLYFKTKRNSIGSKKLPPTDRLWRLNEKFTFFYIPVSIELALIHENETKKIWIVGLFPAQLYSLLIKDIQFCEIREQYFARVTTWQPFLSVSGGVLSIPK